MMNTTKSHPILSSTVFWYSNVIMQLLSDKCFNAYITNIVSKALG